MKFFDEEKSLYNDHNLVVTTHRVIFHLGGADVQAVTLDQLGMCTYTRVDNPWWIAGGAIVALAGVGIITNGYGAGLVLIVLGAALIATFFLTRKSMLIIRAGGFVIRAPASGDRAKELEEAINIMQHAHLEFFAKVSVPAR